MSFNGLKHKISSWIASEHSSLNCFGIKPEDWFFLSTVGQFDEVFANKTKVYIASNADVAEKIFDLVHQSKNVFYYPGLEVSPYSSVQSSEHDLIKRFNVLSKILQNESITIITTFEALALNVIDAKFINENSLHLKINDLISPENLALKLASIGYQNVDSVEEAGTFSKKGEIVDIYPINSEPVRIYYFDDYIEEIFFIDKDTKKTIRDNKLESIVIAPAPAIIIQDEFQKNLRQSLPHIQPQFKNKYDTKRELFNSIERGQLFDNYPVFFPLCFLKPKSLLELLPQNTTFFVFNSDEALKEYEFFYESIISEYASENDRIDSANILPDPSKLYVEPKKIKLPKTLNINTINFHQNIESTLENKVHITLEPLKTFLKTKYQSDFVNIENHHQEIKCLLSTLEKELHFSPNLIVACKHHNSQEEIKFLLSENGIDASKINLQFINFSLEHGFAYKNENLLVLSEGDLFVIKKKKTKKISNTNPDLFAEQIATLKINDFVIHRDHGVGIYKGLETIKVGDQENDFLVITYEDNDKVYVPVYKLNLVQKHADSNAEVKVASLKSKKFLEAKTRARSAVKKLAFDLLKLQAERKLRGGFAFSEPDHIFKEFELAFQFEETPDQEKAIFDVLEDMQKPMAMDRLVCGDVGFGKTEVAMRASFKAVLDKKQVAVLVPTTVLALQHYQNFKKRFKDFPVSIDFLSRFKSAKEEKEVLEKIKEGKVDIIIGTHKLLTDKLEFHDLGLLVIDEEHRFGVGHKEKIKLFKSNVDVLTMTATPIPRTLQLSFLGIRDLSLIQTAPPRRQSIQTYVIKKDDHTLKSAIEKELSRGGQVFFVHNRVHDIEEFEIYIKKLVPKSRITVTHGQLPERELEKRLQEFYEHKSDILLSTTIIESGIDIPNANTMIIDRADTYGLAQLHQLRGRIGRSDRKAYAYFMIPDKQIVSETAEKRLHSLQTYADMGSGFALASCDLEIRGAGDILGAEQSGHIDSIGLELYMDLLQEAILEIKGEEKLEVKNVEIQAPFPAFIPNNYITEPGQRLKFYKRLSNCSNIEKLHDIYAEMTDIFGLAPRELDNLKTILESRLIFQKLAIRQVRVFEKQINIFFDPEILAQSQTLQNKVIEVFVGKPKLYKVLPDSSVQCFFKDAVTQQTLLEFANYIARELRVC